MENNKWAKPLNSNGNFNQALLQEGACNLVTTISKKRPALKE